MLDGYPRPRPLPRHRGPVLRDLLGDLGADVIKVERPGRGDDLRYLGAAASGDERALRGVNRNKRGIAVDLQKPEGARLVFELARRADVVIENFLPGVAARLGVGYAQVSVVNPRVVYASVTGFGQTGPYAKRPGYNTIAQGMSGLMALTGMPGHPPTCAAGSTSDVVGVVGGLRHGQRGARPPRAHRARARRRRQPARVVDVAPARSRRRSTSRARAPAREGNRNPNADARRGVPH